MRKAALLLGALPKEQANSVLELMPPALSLALRSQLQQLGKVGAPPTEVERALTDLEGFWKQPPAVWPRQVGSFEEPQPARAEEFASHPAFAQLRKAPASALGNLLANETPAAAAWILALLTARQATTALETAGPERLLSLGTIWRDHHPSHSVLVWLVEALNEEMGAILANAPVPEDAGSWEMRHANQVREWAPSCRVAWLDALEKVGNPLWSSLKRILYGLDFFADLTAPSILDTLKSTDGRTTALVVRNHAGACMAIQKAIQTRPAEAPYPWSAFARELTSVATLPLATEEKPRQSWRGILEDLDRSSRLHWV